MDIVHLGMITTKIYLTPKFKGKNYVTTSQ